MSAGGWLGDDAWSGIQPGTGDTERRSSVATATQNQENEMFLRGQEPKWQIWKRETERDDARRASVGCRGKGEEREREREREREEDSCWLLRKGGWRFGFVEAVDGRECLGTGKRKRRHSNVGSFRRDGKRQEPAKGDGHGWGWGRLVVRDRVHGRPARGFFERKRATGPRGRPCGAVGDLHCVREEDTNWRFHDAFIQCCEKLQTLCMFPEPKMRKKTASLMLLRLVVCYPVTMPQGVPGFF